VGIDATRKLGGEGQAARARSALSDGEIEAIVTDRWSQYGLGPEPE
jgi:hypothetical protein